MLPVDEYKEQFEFISRKIKNHTDFINSYEKRIEQGRKPFIEGHLYLKKIREALDENKEDLVQLWNGGFYTEGEHGTKFTYPVGKYKFGSPEADLFKEKI